MSDITLTFLIIAVIVGLFVSNRVPAVLIALGTVLALYFSGIVTVNEAMAGLGDPATIFIGSLFVISTALDASGVTAWTGQALIKQAGSSRTRLLVLMMLLVGLLTALISVSGAVAALLPVVVVIAIRLGRPPSQLLMPLVFAGHAGSMLALTGTPVNVLIAEAAREAGLPGFGFFSFTIAGVPLMIGTIAIVVLFGEKLLPNRSGRSLPPDLSKHARTLVEQYRLTDGLFQLRIRSVSPLVGAPANAIDLSGYPDLALVAIQAGAGGGMVTGRPLAADDIIIVRGDADSAGQFVSDQTLAFREETAEPELARTLFNRESGLAEVVIPPRSDFIGQPIFPGMATPSGDLMVLAVQRGGEDLPPQQATLAAGDTVLLQGTWEALDRHLDAPDVLVVDSPELVRRQAVPMGKTARAALAVLALTVVLLATGIVPPAIAGLLGACLMVLTGVLTVDQAYRGIHWTTVILIGGLIPLSTAMTKSGAANLLADTLIHLVGGRSPYALLAGLFWLTAILGQLISNTATALILVPIGLAAARDFGVSGQPVMMTIAIAAAGAFLTPVATPVNLMAMGPGGYEFGDYWKLGLPLLILFFLVATFVVPIFFPF